MKLLEKEKYKIVNILSPSKINQPIFTGSYQECQNVKNLLGFGYTIKKFEK